MLRILPQKFYEDITIRKILVDGLSCAIYKKLDEPVWGKEGYISMHALTMVLQGMLRVENDEGLAEDIVAGKMVLLPKGLYTVSDIFPRGGSFEAMMFFFEPEVIQHFLQAMEFAGTRALAPSHAVMEYSDDIQFFAEALLRLYGDKPLPNRQLTKMKLFELLLLIHNSFPEFPEILAALDNRARKSLREFMLANFHKPLTIEDYAYLSGRSVSTFTRDFKARFEGVAPKQWLIEQRMNKALLLLHNPTVNNIGAVAGECGYENIPHFIKEFHKKFGITPKQLLIENRIKSEF